MLSEFAGCLSSVGFRGQGLEAQVVFGGGAYLQLLFQRGAIEHAGEVLGTPREARLTTEFKLHLLVRNPLLFTGRGPLSAASHRPCVSVCAAGQQEQGINVIKTFLLTLEHTEQDIDDLIAAIKVALGRLREDGLL